MDNSELAKEVITTLSPIMAIGGKEILKGASKDLWDQIKSVFKNKDEEHLVEEIENDPTNLKLQGKMEYVLESELKNNQDLVVMLSEMMEKIKLAEQLKNNVVQKGDNNIAVTGHITNSSININR